MSSWCSLTPEMAKIVSLKTQHRYAKVYQQYLLTLFKSFGNEHSEQIKIFDKLLEKYSSLLGQFKSSYDTDLNLENLTVLLSDAKTHLNLIYKLKNEKCFFEYN